MNAEEIIELFNMQPLTEEGGFYVETYRSNEQIDKKSLPDRYNGNRSINTAILYLITDRCFSLMHRVASDEIFHFYLGDPVEMLLLHPDSTGEVIEIGPDIVNGQHVQTIVPRGVWQGCKVKNGGRWALLGTTVAPGFEFEDFELAKRDELLNDYPQCKQMILSLTNADNA